MDLAKLLKFLTSFYILFHDPRQIGKVSLQFFFVSWTSPGWYSFSSVFIFCFMDFARLVKFLTSLYILFHDPRQIGKVSLQFLYFVSWTSPGW